MTTATKATSGAPLGLTLNGKALYATPNGIKFGARGRVTPDAEVLQALDKGQRRRVRKALYAAGYRRRASAC